MGLADRLIFFPPAPSYDGTLDGLVKLETSRGSQVAARRCGPPGADITVLFAHGNAEDIGDGVWHADRYAALGVSVLAFDYPGYGLSRGGPSESGAYAAADAAYRYLVDESAVSPERIVAHGRSLGGAVMVDLASRVPVGGLVIESTFVSAYRVLTRLPVGPVDQFTSLAKLPSVDAPVLVIHGERDEVVAAWHGHALYDTIPEARRHALWVQRAGHNDLAQVAGDEYWSALSEFCSSVNDSLRPGA